MLRIRTLFTLCSVAFLLLTLFLAGGPQAAEIILDPGHSPGKPGAISCSGHSEYLYNEMLMRTLVRYLHERGIEVDVTRRPGEEMSLQTRAEKARGKRFFLSVHHDSAQPQFLEQKNGRACSKKTRGYSIFVSKKNAFFERSLAYARVLGESLKSMGLTASRHHGEPIAGENRRLLDSNLGIYQYDDLVVLKNAPCPAVLLEAAVIVHPEENLLAQSRPFQLKIAEAVWKTLTFLLRSSPL